MKNCDQYQELMVDALYGEAQSAKDKDLLEAHLSDCPDCAAEFAGMQDVRKKMANYSRPEPDEDYWDGYMQRLDEKLNAQKSRSLLRLWGKVGKNPHQQTVWRRLLVPAAAATLLIGIFIGRYFLPRPGGQEVIVGQETETVVNASPAQSRNQPQALLAHLSSLEPLLIGWNNQSAADGQQVMVDDRVIRDLLMQNYMLKRMVSRQSDQKKKELLESLEMILLEMSDAGQSDPQAMAGVQKMITENSVLFQVRMLQNKNKTL